MTKTSDNNATTIILQNNSKATRRHNRLGLDNQFHQFPQPKKHETPTFQFYHQFSTVSQMVLKCHSSTQPSRTIQTISSMMFKNYSTKDHHYHLQKQTINFYFFLKHPKKLQLTMQMCKLFQFQPKFHNTSSTRHTCLLWVWIQKPSTSQINFSQLSTMASHWESFTIWCALPPPTNWKNLCIKDYKYHINRGNHKILEEKLAEDVKRGLHWYYQYQSFIMLKTFQLHH